SSSKEPLTAKDKAILFNDENDFSQITLPQGSAEVSYQIMDSGAIDSTKKYGIMDEESKLNLNKTDAASLQRLLARVLKYDEDRSSQLAAAIIDWREFGESRLTGFYSDEYYKNLEFPYPVKDADY